MAAKNNSAKAKQKPTHRRVRKLDTKQEKIVKKTAVNVPGSFRLFGRAWRHMWRYKKLFGGILLVYALLYVVLVKGFAANFQLSATREAISEALEGTVGNWEMATTLFGTLLGTAGSASSESAAVYQLFLFVIVSLVIIWALRQTFSGRETPRVREAFYNGPAQIVPYVLILLVVLMQLVPMLIGFTIYGIVITNGIAVGFIEQAVWLVVLLALIGISIFFVSSSVFATYIVALPGMAPVKALKNARQLVRFNRWMVLRKVLFLPLIIAVIMLVIFLPLVLVAPVIAEVMFLLFTLSLLLFSHSYLYLLYRELLP